MPVDGHTSRSKDVITYEWRYSLSGSTIFVQSGFLQTTFESLRKFLSIVINSGPPHIALDDSDFFSTFGVPNGCIHRIGLLLV